jgi:hypothetical protein
VAKQYAPHIERLLAVAASGKLLRSAVAAMRLGVTDSSVHLLQLPKLNARFSAPLDAAATALAFSDDDLLLAGTAKGDLLIWRTTARAKRRMRNKPSTRRGAGDWLRPTRRSSVGDDGVLALHEIEMPTATGPSLRETARRRLSEQPCAPSRWMPPVAASPPPARITPFTSCRWPTQ